MGIWIPKHFDANSNATILGQYEAGSEGHWMARAYYRAGEIYREEESKKDKEMGAFHMFLIDHKKAEKAGAVIDPTIHPHRYDNRLDPELKMLAQVY